MLIRNVGVIFGKVLEGVGRARCTASHKMLLVVTEWENFLVVRCSAHGVSRGSPGERCPPIYIRVRQTAQHTFFKFSLDGCSRWHEEDGHMRFRSLVLRIIFFHGFRLLCLDQLLHSPPTIHVPSSHFVTRFVLSIEQLIYTSHSLHIHLLLTSYHHHHRLRSRLSFHRHDEQRTGPLAFDNAFIFKSAAQHYCSRCYPRPCWISRLLEVQSAYCEPQVAA